MAGVIVKCTNDVADPSLIPTDILSGKLDSLLLSLNTDQNCIGLEQRSMSRELKKVGATLANHLFNSSSKFLELGFQCFD